MYVLRNMIKGKDYISNLPLPLIIFTLEWNHIEVTQVVELPYSAKKSTVVNVSMWCLQGNLNSRAFFLLILASLELYIL